MKYSNEIDKVLRDIFYEDWMNESEYQSIIEHIFEYSGISKQQLSDEIEIGIKNGYSIDEQLNILIKILKT